MADRSSLTQARSGATVGNCGKAGKPSGMMEAKNAETLAPVRKL
jgi:hypothetical protein